MTYRSIYCHLLRLHPERFRKNYGDQMLWIFDESVQSRGAPALLFDALVSLFRQWVFRSGYWRHSQQTILAEGAAPLLDQLQRDARDLHRRAWRINLIWMTGAVVVLLLSRLQELWGPFMASIFINAIGMYWQSRKGRRQGVSDGKFITPSLLSSAEDSRKLYRQRIEGKRDGLVAWCRPKPFTITFSWIPTWNVGGRSLLFVLLWVGVCMLLKPIHGGTGYDWTAFLEFLSGLIVVMVSWRFVKRLNEHAAQAIQREIDAMDKRMDELSTPGPV